MPKNSTRSIEQTSNLSNNQAVSNHAQSGATGTGVHPIKATVQMAIWGILTVSYDEINCNGAFFRDNKDEVIETITRLVTDARCMINPDSHHPQEKPLMWFIAGDTFGITIDVLAVNDADIQNRADEIIHKLARDCDFCIENIERKAMDCEVLNA